MKYNYEGTFLDCWNQHERSLIVNQFCLAVRDGAADVDAVFRWVIRDAQRRLADVTYENQRHSQNLLLSTIDSDEAERFAEFILWREGLAPAERQKLKEESGTDYRAEWMAKQPPTVKQLSYLDSLACHVIPANRLEASELIERYKGGRVGNV